MKKSTTSLRQSKAMRASSTDKRIMPKVKENKKSKSQSAKRVKQATVKKDAQKKVNLKKADKLKKERPTSVKNYKKKVQLPKLKQKIQCKRLSKLSKSRRRDNVSSERESSKAVTRGSLSVQRGSVSLHASHPNYDMSLRPKDEDALAESLLKHSRTFTRRFVRSFHKSWLVKYQPELDKKEWLIDHVNRNLKVNLEKYYPKPVEKIEAKREDFSFEPRNPVLYTRRPKKAKSVSRRKATVTKVCKVYPIPKLVYKKPTAFIGDGGCLGFNLIESNIEDCRKHVRKHQVSKRASQRPRDRPDSECSSEREFAEMVSKRAESLRKVSVLAFRKQYQDYQRQMNGEHPYYFPNLGMLTLGKQDGTEEEVAAPVVAPVKKLKKNKVQKIKKEKVKKEIKVVKQTTAKKSFKEDFTSAPKRKKVEETTLGKRALKSPDTSDMQQPEKVIIEVRTSATAKKEKTPMKAATPAKLSVLKDKPREYLEDAKDHSELKQALHMTTAKKSSAESTYRLEQVVGNHSGKKTYGKNCSVKESLNKIFDKIDLKKSVDKGKLSIKDKHIIVDNMLSEKAQNVIETVIKKKAVGSVKKSLVKDTTHEIANSILNIPEPKVRFEEFLKPTSSMPLPFSYQRLLKKFEKLDDLMNFLNMKQAQTFASVVVKAYANSMNEHIDTSDMRKILAVWPTAYSVQWERHSLNDYDMELKILFTVDAEKPRMVATMMNRAQLNERKAEFERKLMSYAKQRHTIVVKELGDSSFDLDRLKRWHPGFDLDLEEIAQAPLPPKPTINSQISMKKIMDMNNEKLMELVYKVKQSIQKESLSDTEDNRNFAGSRLIAIIREKERLNNLKKNSLPENPFLNKKTELEWLINMLRILYTTKRVSNIFLKNAADHIVKKSKDRITSVTEVSEMINYLAGALPAWLKVVDNPEGPILRMNTDLQTNNVLSLFHEAMN